MIAPSAALGLARSLAVYYGRPWAARRHRAFLAAFVGPGDLVFDVGAHVGNRTRILHALGARVIALEPQPLFHGFLARTLPRERVVLLPEAVAAAPGEMTLHVSRRHPTVSTLSDRWIETVSTTSGFAGVAWPDRVTVPVTTLDRLIAAYGRPRFVKIDVEGMEAEILKGLSEPLAMVAVEYLPAALAIAFEAIDRLEALGFDRFNRVEAEGHAFARAWTDADGIRADLRGLAAGSRSGDVYAASTDPRATAPDGPSASRPGSAPTSTIAP